MSEPLDPHGIFKTMLIAFGDQCQACQADDPLMTAESFIQENFGVIETLLGTPSPVGTAPSDGAPLRNLLHGFAFDARNGASPLSVPRMVEKAATEIENLRAVGTAPLREARLSPERRETALTKVRELYDLLSVEPLFSAPEREGM